MVRAKALIWATAMLSTAGNSQTCPVPPTAKPLVSLSDVIKRAKAAVVQKDEFETTAAFQERASAALTKMGSAGEMTISWPIDSGLTYDADTQTEALAKYGMPTTCMMYTFKLASEAKSLRFGETPKYGDGDAYCLTRKVSSTNGTPYKASNSYGASVTVVPVFERREGIFLGMGDSNQGFFEGKERAYEPGDAFKFTATPEQARSLKINAALLIRVKPRAPLYVNGLYQIEAKINSPVEITMATDLLVGEVDCVAIYDSVTGEIFQSRQVRQPR